MKSLISHSLKFILPAVLLLAAAAAAANAQDARLNFERLNAFGERARDVVEVNVDGKLLDLAKRVTIKAGDKDAKKIGEAISGLKGIYVRVFNFERENQYDIAEVEAVRAQMMTTPGWEKLARVRSKKNDQKIDVFTMFSGDVMSGVAILISESKSVALVNIIGTIDIDMLAELSGKLNIPKIDIEREAADKPKN